MLAAPIVIAFSITLIFMVILRPIAIAVGLVDKPGGRKAHIGEVPIVGGIAMFVGIFFGFALVPDLGSEFWYLLLSGGLLVFVGAVDDRWDLPAAVRLVAQTCAVIIMAYGGGAVVTAIGDPLALGNIGLGPFALIFTVLVTVTAINAFNFVDGVDGLAGSMALVALGGIALCEGGSVSVTSIASIVTASVLGFLVFNYPIFSNRRLRSFMGDAGSTLLGLIVVWLMIKVCQSNAGPVSPVIGLWFVAIPLFDIFTCFVRRIAKGRSPFRPGREHFHHLLYRAGFSVRQVLGILTIMAAVYAIFGLIGRFLEIPDYVMFGAWIVCALGQYWAFRKFATIYRHRRRRDLRAQLAA